jgi:hypothetical protein
MTNDIDWEVKMEALDASLPRRLERAAQLAERSDIWTDTERLMPATGVADLIWEAHSEILGWRALNKLRQDSRTCPLGEDCDLTVAWMAGRESAKDEAQAMVAAALEEAAAFLDENALQKGYTKTPQGRTAMYYARKTRALIPDAGAALDRALETARAEEREDFQALLLEAATDLEAYIEGDWPADRRSQYPSYQAKWKRDMELVNRIRARVAELKEDQ